MISVNQLTVHFGSVELFNDITFIINPHDRIGLVGKNGAGKSTMLKIIAGLQQPEGGEVVISEDTSIGYLPQQMVLRDGKTVRQEACSAFEETLKLEKEIQKINKQLTERTDYESDGYMKLIEKLSHYNDRFEMLGGGAMTGEVEKTLLGLGFMPDELDRPTTTFSGGWRMRIELAKILLRKPGVFLLDEPTNHLDIESIQWLEDFLKDYNGAVLVISHDRAFLDNVTNRTIEISLGRIYDYDAAYSKFVILREERRAQQLAAYRNQQKMIADTEAFIERFRYKPTKAVQVQSRIKQLEKIERLEVDEEDLSAIHVKFPPAPRSGTVVVEVKELSKRYGPKLILDKVDLVVERGEHIAFVGRNGEGKSTLSKIIMGETEHEGLLKVGHNVNIGYFAQNQDEIMDGEATVFETLDEIAVGDIRTKVRDILGSFLFRGEDIDKKVKVLSGGERSRLAMAKLLLQPYNLLLLDEPTNHMDMRSKDTLKQALLQYNGTIILVSHDRQFLDGLVSKVYEFKSKKIKQFIGGIYDFLQKKKLDNLHELERKEVETVIPPSPSKISQNKMTYEEKKEYDRELRKITSQISKSEKEIEQYEKEIAEIDGQMANPEKINDNELFDRYALLKKNLQKEMDQWEKLNEDLQNFQNANNVSI
ncbi:MAG: ABC-F family ATP-binding cassette domain-containing protein [Bacteroidota bacterium]|nr:ABC-F family ATP-binding cassette domain-containing protein [Bacteroidota bacterium]MDP4274308.1 ABC-F family ATP-binding cassette domain-containing protein [Bacteroidota bacterium]